MWTQDDVYSSNKNNAKPLPLSLSMPRVNYIASIEISLIRRSGPPFTNTDQ